jgi:hypothetical protein
MRFGAWLAYRRTHLSRSQLGDGIQTLDKLEKYPDPPKRLLSDGVCCTSLR